MLSSSSNSISDSYTYTTNFYYASIGSSLSLTDSYLVSIPIYISSSSSHTISDVYSASIQPTSWLSGWSYRKAINISGSTAGAISSYPINITVYYGSGTDNGSSIYLNGKCKTDFSDVRFVDPSTGDVLPYFIEYYVESSYAVFWVNVPNIPVYPDYKTIYIYYGNSSATSNSNQFLTGFATARSHQTSSSYYPSISFDIYTGSDGLNYARVSSSTSSIGDGYIWIVVPTSFILNQTVTIKWKYGSSYSFSSSSGSQVKFELWSGAYYGSQSIAVGDVTPYSTLAQYTFSQTNESDQQVTTFTVSSVPSTSYVTLVVRLADVWTYQWLWVGVTSIQIGSYTLDFNSVPSISAQTVTTGYESYGYFRSYLNPEPSISSVGQEEANTQISISLASSSILNDSYVYSIPPPLSISTSSSESITDSYTYKLNYIMSSFSLNSISDSYTYTTPSPLTLNIASSERLSDSYTYTTPSPITLTISSSESISDSYTYKLNYILESSSAIYFIDTYTYSTSSPTTLSISSTEELSDSYSYNLYSSISITALSKISFSDTYSYGSEYSLTSVSSMSLSDSYNIAPYTGYVLSFMSNIRLSDIYTTSQVYYINIYSYNVFYDTYKAIVVYENKALRDIGALLLGIFGGYLISKELKKKRKG
jgi:hypothetical protein